jgi:predicted phosphodiesterase
MTPAPSPLKTGPLGIMADSHGQADRIAAAIQGLTAAGCRRLIHLGDITDTNQPETAAACTALLQAAGVTALRGNNDHTLAALAREAPRQILPERVLDFLERLPYVHREGPAWWFAHSLPFEQDLGAACLVHPLDRAMLERFGLLAPSGVLFRGHSHQPERRELASGQLRCYSFTAGEIVDLTGSRPCAVTCGALSEGWSMIFDPEAGRVACLRW